MVGGWCIITAIIRQAHVDWRIYRAEHTCTLLATTASDSSQHDVVTVSESHSDINKRLESNQVKSNQIKTYRVQIKLTKKTNSASMADQTSSTVDETPISPVREARGRQNSLEKHLQHRPEQQELKDRHILLDTNAAP